MSVKQMNVLRIMLLRSTGSSFDIFCQVNTCYWVPLHFFCTGTQIGDVNPVITMLIPHWENDLHQILQP